MKPSAAEKQLLLDMLALPTAPFAEGRVVEFLIERFRGVRSLSIEQDDAGNLLLRYQRGRRRVARPPAFIAHLDHPGFVASADSENGRLAARWFGGVEPSYFRGAGVRFFENGRWVRGRIASIRLQKDVAKGRPRRVESVTVRTKGRVSNGAVGMWDLPGPRIRGRRVLARGCDDIAGAAGIVAAIDRLMARKTTHRACFLFTRAEEAGFVGAIAACKNGFLPRRCAVLAVECSSQRPDARIGDGPILRVGDRLSVFSPALTDHCKRVAEHLAGTKRGFTFQRKLMDGGSCESSVFCDFGYDATGLCVALGNYHNRDTARRVIASEYIDLLDWAKMVTWFTALIDGAADYGGRRPELRRRLDRLYNRHRVLLRRSARDLPKPRPGNQ